MATYYRQTLLPTLQGVSSLANGGMVMANIKPVAWGIVFFLLSLLSLGLPAQAENWVEVTVPGGASAYYDSDSAFVDNATGLAVVKLTVWADVYDRYIYLLWAFDCSRWEYYTIGILQPEGWIYDYYGEMGVNSVGTTYSAALRTAQWICNKYSNLASGNIPFDFKFSNY